MDKYLITLLAIMAWREARGEGQEGMRYVMHVLRNRVLAKWGDWDECITKRNQFSSMGTAGDGQLIVWPDDDDIGFRQVFQKADAIFNGLDDDPTDGALYYANLKVATSGWFFTNIVGKPSEHPMTVKLGRHTFFR